MPGVLIARNLIRKHVLGLKIFAQVPFQQCAMQLMLDALFSAERATRLRRRLLLTLQVVAVLAQVPAPVLLMPARWQRLRPHPACPPCWLWRQQRLLQSRAAAAPRYLERLAVWPLTASSTNAMAAASKEKTAVAASTVQPTHVPA